MKFTSTLLTTLALGLVAHAQPNPLVDPFITVRDPVVVLTHARVIDGRGGEPLENQTLVLRDGRIAALGADGSVTIPEGATVRDLTGKTVLPGFVLVHEHLYYSSFIRGPFHLNEMEFSFPRLYLAAGITSARTTGCIEPYTDLKLKKEIDAGAVIGPKLHLTAPYFDGEGTGVPQLHAITTADAARRQVNYWADEGFTSLKMYQNLPADLMAVAIEAGHARGMQVTGHIGKVSYREAIGLGIDNLEHGFLLMSDFNPGRKPGDPADAFATFQTVTNLDPDSPEINALIQLLIERNVALTSTLAIFETFVPGRRMATQAELDTLAPPLRESYLVRWAAMTAQNAPLMKNAFAKGMQLEAKFFRAGGHLVVGTDPTGYGGCMAGYGSWRAIELLVDAGLTPLEAIQVASINGAKLLKIDADVGSVEVGKAADLVVVNGNPAQKITDIRRAETVFKDGIGYDTRKLLDSVKGLVGIQ